jgi:hypothetical protein
MFCSRCVGRALLCVEDVMIHFSTPLYVICLQCQFGELASGRSPPLLRGETERGDEPHLQTRYILRPVFPQRAFLAALCRPSPRHYGDHVGGRFQGEIENHRGAATPHLSTCIRVRDSEIFFLSINHQPLADVSSWYVFRDHLYWRTLLSSYILDVCR